jgi:hypothetical protein
MRTATILAALSLLPAAFAQNAAFTPFGTGCSFQGQALSIGNQGLPVIGSSSFQITYSGPNFTFSSGQQIAQPFLALGFTPLVTTIPQSILPQQPAGCQGFLAPDVLISTPSDPTRSNFLSFVPMPVPNSNALAGLVFLAQWLCVIQQCGFAGCGIAAAATSDAAFVTVGF